MDFSKGRIAETLKAAEILMEQGENVCLMINGPVGALSCLIDASKVFMAFRKKRELMKDILWKIGNEGLRYIEEAQNRGIRMFNWEDPTIAVNIVGPKIAKQIVEDFTYDYIKEILKLTQGKSIVHLCPKTSFALVGTEKAHAENVDLTEAMTYGQACTCMPGEIDLCGLNCIKNTKLVLGNAKFKELVLD